MKALFAGLLLAVIAAYPVPVALSCDDCDHGDEHAGHGDEHGHDHDEDAKHGGAGEQHHESDDHGHGDDEHHGHDGEHHGEHHDEEPTGPHGGRIVEGGGLAAEIAIFEEGVAPQLRVWVRDGDRILDPKTIELNVTLHRLARDPQVLTFQPRGDFLLADQIIEEPHSFAVDVDARAGGKKLATRYESYEARVTIPTEEAAAGGVTSDVAGPRDLERSLRLTGRVGIASDRMAELKPRFAGIVQEAAGTIGDRVAAGQKLATLESNATLARFPVVSPLSGVLLDRRAVAGSSADEDDTLYVVADLSEVWADFDVYGSDTAAVRVGEAARVRDDARDVEADVKISYVSPLRDVHTQTTLARAVLPNADGRWAPGAFVTAEITLEEPPAKVAVPPSALQTWRGHTSVFVFSRGIWEARPVLVGRSGEAWIELLSGVEPGTTVATGNTFLLRAEVEKAGATHAH